MRTTSPSRSLSQTCLYAGPPIRQKPRASPHTVFLTTSKKKSGHDEKDESSQLDKDERMERRKQNQRAQTPNPREGDKAGGVELDIVLGMRRPVPNDYESIPPTQLPKGHYFSRQPAPLYSSADGTLLH
ncbi:hypothetical protein CROQUDRAFT_91436 [Cronartium quercuum f. sp. fusiforme G11]|uniref:Uncharacterized protein n=1 Tax=Cronartium quercuum f. sp. fusiforme G11 TaxID=708437 RepID=A0A9P6NL10_9BASI|nr:hypothetical protein CROQUDRAFT_91436 [Cronartium quercuum f. sp. fusiforme G11]